MWEARFKQSCNNVHKLKMHLTKLKMEKDFYKKLYRKYQLKDAQNAIGLNDAEEFAVTNRTTPDDFQDSNREQNQAKAEKYP